MAALFISGGHDDDGDSSTLSELVSALVTRAAAGTLRSVNTSEGHVRPMCKVADVQLSRPLAVGHLHAGGEKGELRSHYTLPSLPPFSQWIIVGSRSLTQPTGGPGDPLADRAHSAGAPSLRSSPRFHSLLSLWWSSACVCVFCLIFLCAFFGLRFIQLHCNYVLQDYCSTEVQK